MFLIPTVLIALLMRQLQVVMCTWWPLMMFCSASPELQPTLFGSLRSILQESDNQLLLELQQQRPLKEEYDFIIVGAGTAGSTLASRLSEVAGWDILLIEAGGHEQFFTDIPGFVGGLQRTEMDWQYVTEPSSDYCRGYQNNQCRIPRGKILGGSSVLNYMLATRGNPKDFDSWAEIGNPGWSYKDVLPYFIKAENITIPELRKNPYHGVEGPLQISHTKYHTTLGKAWLEAGRELGHRVGDYNGESQTSFSYFQFTQNPNGRRSSNPRSYLYPVLRQRKNLTIKVHAFVSRVTIEGNKAVGVELEYEGQTYKVKARNEVILSAGAINSPQILMLSGIGPKDQLSSFNIPVNLDLPVGQTFQDHFSIGALVFVTNLTTKELTLNDLSYNPKHFIDYVNHGYGPYTIPGGNEGVFFYDTKEPNNPKGNPDIEMHYSTVSVIPEEAVRGYKKDIYDLIFTPLLSNITWAIQPIIMHPKSRGKVELRSKNPHDKPKIIPNYFSNPDDIAVIIKGIRKALQVSRTHAFRKFNSKPIKIRFPGCPYAWGTDAYFECMMRTTTLSNYHQCCTCSMGPNGVVDEKLRVHGISSLRVVDASIMPAVPAAHTNIPTNMIAEKASDIIKQDYNAMG